VDRTAGRSHRLLVGKPAAARAVVSEVVDAGIVGSLVPGRYDDAR